MTKSLSKGEQTRAAILDTALALASRDGLEGLTIGLLADKMRMSKSGVFSHFGSREELLIAVLQRYHENFEQEVFYPSMSEARGLPRLRALYMRWVKHLTMEIASGCIYISGATEYDDRPGAVRDELTGMVKAWQAALRRCAAQAVDMGHLRADTDLDQLVFEMYGLILALHHDARLIKRGDSAKRARQGFERLIASVATADAASASAAVAPAPLHPAPPRFRTA